MLGEQDLAHRFDYLFAPVSIDEFDSSSDDGAARTDALPTANDDSMIDRPSRLALAVLVLATLAAATAVGIVLMQQPESANIFDKSSNLMPTSASEPSATAEPIAVSPVTVVSSVADAPQPTAVIQREPLEPSAQPQQSAIPPAPTQTAASEAPVTHAPTTRAPISVSPEPRAPFPNQNAPRGDSGQQRDGGLLPGLGLPGPL